jgi:DNA-binding transcriptional LysR family regulator
VDRAFKALRQRRRIAFEVNDIMGLLNLVSHGLGVAIVPGGFAAIPAEVGYVPLTKAPVMDYVALTRGKSKTSALSQGFLDMALATL